MRLGSRAASDEESGAPVGGVGAGSGRVDPDGFQGPGRHHAFSETIHDCTSSRNNNNGYSHIVARLEQKPFDGTPTSAISLENPIYCPITTYDDRYIRRDRRGNSETRDSAIELSGS